MTLLVTLHLKWVVQLFSPFLCFKMLRRIWVLQVLEPQSLKTFRWLTNLEDWGSISGLPNIWQRMATWPEVQPGVPQLLGPRASHLGWPGSLRQGKDSTVLWKTPPYWQPPSCKKMRYFPLPWPEHTIEGEILIGEKGRTGINPLKLYAFIPWSLQECCRQIPAAPKKLSCWLLYKHHSWVNFSCGRNAGNTLADNTVIYLRVSIRPLYTPAHQNYNAVDAFLPSVWKGKLWVVVFQLCSHVVAIFFLSTNTVSHCARTHTQRDLHIDADGHSRAVLPHGSQTSLQESSGCWLN